MHVSARLTHRSKVHGEGASAPSFIEFWDSPLKDLRRYVVGRWKEGIGRVQEVRDDSPERLAFAEMAKANFEKRGVPVVRLRTWLNVQLPDPGEGYDKGYPHVHADETAVTLVHYIDPGDVPADLHIFDGDEVEHVITPEAGKTVYMPNGVKHGVLKNQGNSPRVAMIATAYPM